MMEETDQTADSSEPAPLWEVVPVTKYAVPGAQAQKTAAAGWRSLKKIFQRKDIADTPFKDEQELHALPEVRLAHLVPPLPWKDAAAAASITLQDWMAIDSRATAVKFFIGQPFSGHAEIVSLLGDQHQAVEIKPPSSEQILSNDHGWFDSWPSSATFWVLPNLEHCYLRHAKGLDLVRRLLSLAANGQLGKGLIGCDSWAWAYIQRIFPLPHVDAVTLQAFDAERLQDLICDLMLSGAKRKVYCYNAANGQEIIGPSAQQKQLQKEFAELASHCRGNVAVAITYWRDRLRLGPDEDVDGDDKKTAEHPVKDRSGEHIWVASMPPEAELPMKNDEGYLLLLHTMLLHGGLSDLLLTDLLPFSASHSQGLLGQLQQFGIVTCIDGRWQVRELAYLAVRRLLSGHDYLTDEF
ncbi:MAG: hypothetical protein R6V21_12045 [Pelovirga sp.]